ncbi:MAG: 4Fe-4S dicluster domain-containing protein [Chloroflexi bacterium]|nr:4Fe-4S dicluster domain-containing protein [Chloroflexota bacterium]
MAFLNIFKNDSTKRTALAAGHVVPDGARCVQCGICTYNCPIGIDVRAHAWRGEAVTRSECLTCGECVARCPRGVLRFERTDLFERRDE